MMKSLAVAMCSCALVAQAFGGATNYHIAHELPLQGEANFDNLRVDSDGRVFVTRGSLVQVIDAAGSAVIGEIPNTPGAHSVALAGDLGRGYISAGRTSSVVVFALISLTRLAELKTTGEDPDAIVYETTTRRLFTFNGRGRNATVFNAVTNDVVGTIDLDAKPEFAVADGAGRVYVNLEDKNSIATIDAKTLAVLHVWPMAGCEGPTGLALDRANDRLIAACSNKTMAVVDARSGRVVTTLPIGGFADGAGFDPGTGLAFVSGGEGTLTIAHEDTPDRFTVVQTLATERGARTMALNEQTHRVYVSTAKYVEAGPAAAGAPTGPRSTAVPGSFKLLVIEP